MPLPSGSDQHVDSLLTNLSVAYSQAPGNFVADSVFPRVGSPKQSNKYATYNQADAYRDHFELRTAGAESAGMGYRVSNDSFYCDVFAAHIDVDDQTRAAADNPFAPAEDALRTLLQWERIKREREWATDFFTTSVWTGGTSADPTAASLSGAWDDPSSTPIENLAEQSHSILTKTGYKPNVLVVNNLGWVSLKNHPDIVDRIKHTSGAPVTEDIVARLLDLDRVVVGRGVRNTAVEGVTASYSQLLGNNALLVYAAPSAGIYSVSGGYTFTWTGYPGSQDGRRVKRFRIEERAAERIEVEATWDQKLIGADLGVFIQTVAS